MVKVTPTTRTKTRKEIICISICVVVLHAVLSILCYHIYDPVFMLMCAVLKKSLIVKDLTVQMSLFLVEPATLC